MKEIKIKYFFLLLVCTAVVFLVLFPLMKKEQAPLTKFYKDRVTKNIKFLCKDLECIDNFFVDDRGLFIYPESQKTGKPEFILYWEEIPQFNELLKKKTNAQLIDILKRKESKYLSGFDTTLLKPAIYPVCEWKGLRVALDPGHIASDLQEAKLEQRYVRAEGKLFNQKLDIEFFEANLAYTTSLVLKEMLEKKGAEVMITHEYGKSAFHMNYSEWRKSDYKNDVILGYKENWYGREKFDYLMTGNATDLILYQDVFRNKDFVSRGRKINDFNPDITLVIHFNAKEGSERYGESYSQPVNENYTMVMIPGAFLGIEIDGRVGLEQRFELLRLLVSNELEASDIFASHIIDAFVEYLKVDALPKHKNLNSIKHYSVPSNRSEGVYHRNIYLTRVVRGPIAYSEALYQDNRDEMALLGRNDLIVQGIKTSSRVREVAHAYLIAIKGWLDYNKEFAKKVSTNKD